MPHRTNVSTKRSQQREHTLAARVRATGMECKQLRAIPADAHRGVVAHTYFERVSAAGPEMAPLGPPRVRHRRRRGQLALAYDNKHVTVNDRSHHTAAQNMGARRHGTDPEAIQYGASPEKMTVK
jgi:hypothetical protein